MGKSAFKILWTAVWMTVAAAATLREGGNQMLPGHQFFKTLPKDYQPDFLTFELSRGYLENKPQIKFNDAIGDMDIVFPDGLDISKDRVEHFKALQVPQNFTNNLFNFVETEFNLDQLSIRTLILNRSICIENGVCIDLNDIGSLCCPF